MPDAGIILKQCMERGISGKASIDSWKLKKYYLLYTILNFKPPTLNFKL